MGLKKLIVLLGGLVLLTVLVFFKNARQSELPTDPIISSSKDVFENGLEVESVKALEIRRASDEATRLRLEKNGAGEWTLAGHFGARAKKENVHGFLEKIRSLRGEVRSESPDVLKDYALSEDKAIHIELSGDSNAKLADVLLSLQRPRGSQNFVRLGQSNRVFITDTDLLANLGLFSEDSQWSYKIFADLRPIAADSTKIASFELMPPGGKTLVFEKGKDPKETEAWSLAGDANAKVDKVKVNALFSELFNINATEVVDPTLYQKELSNAKPWLVIHRAPSEKPETQRVILGPHLKDKKTVILQVLPDNIVYEVAEPQLEGILKKNRESFL